MIDDDLTIDGADLLAEVRAAGQVDHPRRPGPNSRVTLGDEHSTVATATAAATATAVSACASDSLPRWRPPVATVPMAVIRPSVCGMSRPQLAIVAGVCALGIALGVAILLSRAGHDTSSSEPIGSRFAMTTIDSQGTEVLPMGTA